MLWHADVDLAHTQELNDDQVDALTRNLPGCAIVSHDTGRGWLILRFEVEARTLGAAVDRALRIARDVAAQALGVPIDPQGVRVLPMDEHDRDLADSERFDLVGYMQIGDMLGVSKQRAGQVAEMAGFPTPVVPSGVRGPLYPRTAVARFIAEWERKPGRPRKAG
jgi:hypothetical protein